MPETRGGGYIEVIKDADLLAPITRCECKWGENDCPNDLHMVIVCRNVKGFTVACEPHVVGFASHVDPHDGSYVYAMPEQFERMREAGLYSKYNTYAEWFRAISPALMSYSAAVHMGIFPSHG